MIDLEFIQRCTKKEPKNMMQFLHILTYFNQNNIEFIKKGVPEYHIEYLQHNYHEEMRKICDLINSFEFESVSID